jgi:hypothetical protein
MSFVSAAMKPRTPYNPRKLKTVCELLLKKEFAPWSSGLVIS